MNRDVCRAPLSWETLVDYWLEELPPPDEAAIEEHLFACASCSASLDQFAALEKGLRRAFGSSSGQPVVTREALDALHTEGLRTIEVTIAPHQQVEVTVPEDVDLLVARLLVSELMGVQRLDVEICDPGGDPYYVAQQAPFEARRGEVLILCQRHVAIQHRVVLFRLLTVDARGNKAAAEYTLAAVEA